jgi:hypothetical protein
VEAEPQVAQTVTLHNFDWFLIQKKRRAENLPKTGVLLLGIVAEISIYVESIGSV